MITATPQHLRVLNGSFVVEHAEDEAIALAGPWISLVRAPEGLTVVRELRSGETVEDGEAWAALYSGDTAHGLDVPGMLALLLSPLAQGGVPVFVASTYNADLILVPRDRVEDAARVLRAIGHRIDL
ncbi:ACT domain-containing protein [Streptomyces zaomyceticus]|uniref:ACT domain-containing protein n=1 Tax=Streptomyces zaomyceticus TaxID=68286 RepID=UPI001674BDB0|nr:ACT domain-containing protein [Streptomyces zaomyceticus]GHG16719.1 acetyltransferase [Streptomyces zaomyceticus]